MNTTTDQLGLFPYAGRIRQMFLTAGYPSVSVSVNGKTKTEYVHRLIVERRLGRKLRSGEVVHHKDGNKLNFFPNNLEVVDSRCGHVKMHAQEYNSRMGATPGLTQYCFKCEAVKGIDCFYSKQRYCKTCGKQYLKEWKQRRNSK